MASKLVLGLPISGSKEHHANSQSSGSNYLWTGSRCKSDFETARWGLKKLLCSLVSPGAYQQDIWKKCQAAAFKRAGDWMGRTSKECTAVVEGCYQRSTCHCFRKGKELELWKYPSLHATQQPKHTTTPHPWQHSHHRTGWHQVTVREEAGQTQT